MAYIAWIEEADRLYHRILCSACWEQQRTQGKVAQAITRLTGAERDSAWEAAHKEVREVNAADESTCQGCQKKMVRGKVIEETMNHSNENDPVRQQFQEEYKALGQQDDITIQLPPDIAYSLIGQLQLALRSPDNVGPTAEWVKQFITDLAAQLCPPGSALETVVERGWEGFDVETQEPLT